VVDLQSSEKGRSRIESAAGPEPGLSQGWLSLGEACRILQVNEATLRQWADNGYLRVYRTPGGHRRFFADDVMGMTRQASPGSHGGVRESPLVERSALRRIRRRLSHEDVVRQSWYQSVEEEGRDRMRLFGRRLLSLLLQEAPAGAKVRGRRQEALEESLMLGHEYGAEMAERGVSLKDTVEAFIFFRTMVLDSAKSRSWGQILEMADRVLVGVVESYQKRLAVVTTSDSDPTPENRRLTAHS
jgi:excisionase family DNA binding protein